jgi:cell filamentation protein
MKTEQQSLYCYEGSDVLMNLGSFNTQEKLDQYERRVTANALMSLEKTPLYGTFNAAHLCAIHRFLFEDVYAFAGQYRKEEIAKGAFRFASVRFLEQSLDYVLDELKGEKYLKDLSVDEFSTRAAYYLSELNVIHPFREGNGRTQREFIRLLALQAGYKIDWSHVDQDTYMDASIRSVHNFTDLSQVIRQCIVHAKPNKNYMSFYAEQKDSKIS